MSTATRVARLAWIPMGGVIDLTKEARKTLG
jgi:hypothetical protein